MKPFYTPPSIIKKISKEYVWESACNKVLLTFDDGPTIENTEKIIRLLNDLRIKTVFFCVGNNIKYNKQLSDIIISNGHAIGNHTFNHRRLIGLNCKEIKKEIRMTNEILYDNHNYHACYFRPPYGIPVFGLSKILQSFNLKNIMWSLLTMDYKDDIRVVKFAVENYLKNNSIVVLHDNKKSKKIILDSIKIIVDEVAAKGFEIGEPSECLN